MIKTEVRTSDIVLAAYLKLNSCEMTSIDKQGNKGTFVFADVEQTLLDKFDLTQGLVEPVAFNNMIKQLTTSVRRVE